MRRTLLIFSFLIVLTATTLLITGSPVLLAPVFEKPFLPFGNLLTWLGMIGLPILIISAIPSVYAPIHKADKLFQSSLLACMFFAAMWGFVTYFLADNWAGQFKAQEAFRGSARASVWFWYYTAAVVAAPLLVLALFGLYRLVAKNA